MAELLVVGSVVFWALILLEAAVLFFCVEKETGICATLSIVAFLAIMQWGFSVDLFAWGLNNWTWLLIYAGVYFLVGGGWGIVKWYLYVRDRLDEYTDMKISWLKGEHKTGTKIPEELKDKWNTYLDYSGYRRDLSCAPEAHFNKNRILRWMTFWPPSMIWTLLDDFVKRIFNEFYRFIANQLQAISNRIYAGVDEDFKTTT